MIIEIGSKWVKDGEVVEVKQVSEILNDNLYYPVIWFSSLKEKYKKILTERDFLEQYKPYEVVYEYAYSYFNSKGDIAITELYYDNDTEFLSVFSDVYAFQRLDFTKRERKQ